MERLGIQKDGLDRSGFVGLATDPRDRDNELRSELLREKNPRAGNAVVKEAAPSILVESICEASEERHVDRRSLEDVNKSFSEELL
jgi:hypothetical protein